MTTLTIDHAMPLHGDVTRRDAAWVGLIDASDLSPIPESIRLETGELFGRARLLVRDRGAVRGYITLPTAAGALDPAAVRDAVEALPQVAPRVLPDPVRISIVVCTHDRAAMLSEALEAIRGIRYPLFEVIVVDNAPSDASTHDLVASEFPGFRYVREDAVGLSHARNAGLRAATAPIVAFTDDDVIVDPEWLWAIAAGFARAEDVGCVSGVVPTGELRNDVQAYFDARVSWSKLTTAREFRLSAPPADLPMFPFCVGEFGTGANFAVRREHMLSLGGFDTALGAGTRTKGGEDLDMFLRVLFDGKAIVVEPSALVWHRHRDDLDALTAQAVGYGRGFGAWVTTVAFEPRMLGAALARAPRAVARLLRKPMSTVDDEGPAVLSDQARKVGRVELASVLGGPASYFAERRAQRAAGTLDGPPSRGPRMERACWSALPATGGIAGLISLLPLPSGLSLLFLALFVLVGPGALVRAWVVLPPHFAPMVVPAVGISAMLLASTAIVYAQLWSPHLWLLALAGLTVVGGVISAGVRRTA